MILGFCQIRDYKMQAHFGCRALIGAIIQFAILAHCLHLNLPGSCVCLSVLLYEGINKMSL
jgi:hypothetical protein